MLQSLVLVSKGNGKGQLFLDLARFNQVLIRPLYRGPTLNGILLRLTDVKYFTLIGTSSGYHNLTLDERSLYLTTCSGLLGRYRYIWLPLGAAQAVTCSRRQVV